MVPARGAKQRGEVTERVKEEHRAVRVDVARGGDADEMVIARDIDPTYGETLDKARKAGVEVLAYKCKLTSKSIRVTEPVAFLD